MRPRLPISRILRLRPFRPPNSPRLFTHNRIKPRPTLEFLAPLRRRPAAARFFTTENKEQYKRDVKLGLKLSFKMMGITFMAFIMLNTVSDERWERKYNPPMEWRYWTRQSFVNAMLDCDPENAAQDVIEWSNVGESFEYSVKRLEDPNLEGAGLVRSNVLVEGDVIEWSNVGESFEYSVKRLEDPNLEGAGLVRSNVLVEGVGKTGYDVSMKSEDWRRGYYICLMGAAKGAEYIEDMVRDKNTGRITPKKYVIGPSNPIPQPLLPNSHYTAPKEEDTEVAFDKAEVWYMRILTTQGFTQKQYVDAALAYAAFLDYQKAPEKAMEMYSWAIDIARSSLPEESKTIIDPKTGILDIKKGLPSLNLINISTALGIHHASHSNLSLALPIFLSVLRARRSSPPPPPPPPKQPPKDVIRRIKDFIHLCFVRPPPPPLPVDGTAPPLRTPEELCQEAGIMNYIGEILYVSESSVSSKEDALAWTREAVDVSEEQLAHAQLDREGTKICKECLHVGVGNWDRMVSMLASAERQERKANEGKVVGGWLGFGGKGQQKGFLGRWESEEGVVRDRMKRAALLL
ncbi:hypothetical protein HYFRA_00011832 [Hymenoscyphus fraxineus]|uniref:Uncharacterized protein n=1 Tax=Hymenoscyphus fraxineus TaxID=746836 RepID=A0A9N9PLV2_9HELO|nr:hypothetical protein HYFRA_00011832 [Hymenoscyphus fraxineus]